MKNMIQESYVTFEQAKALKELGFPQWDENTHIPYYEGYSFDGKETSIISSNCKMEYSKVPFSLVQKWLRNDKGIEIFPYRETKYIFGKAIVNTNYSLQIILCDVEGYPKNSTLGLFEVFDTPEQALSAGIDKCIELLKEK